MKTDTPNIQSVLLEILHEHLRDFYQSPEAAVKAIAESFSDEGQQTPIILTPHKEIPGHFTIIGGKTRVRAGKLLGWKEIQAEIREYKDEEDELSALLSGNDYRIKTCGEIANEMAMRKAIWAKKPGTRVDLMLPEEMRLSTRERLAQRFRMSPAQVDKYLSILNFRPDFFKKIEEGKMSIDGGVNLKKFIEENDLQEINDEDLMGEVINATAAELFEKVGTDELELEEAFYIGVRLLTRYKKPKVKKESEASDQPLQIPPTAPQESTDGSQSENEEPDNSTSHVDVENSFNDSGEEIEDDETEEEQKNEAADVPRNEVKVFRCEHSDCPCYRKYVKEADDYEGL